LTYFTGDELRQQFRTQRSSRLAKEVQADGEEKTASGANETCRSWRGDALVEVDMDTRRRMGITADDDEGRTTVMAPDPAAA